MKVEVLVRFLVCALTSARAVASKVNTTDPQARAEWCQREYVSAKDCDEWVADQLSRREERRADEEARREERRKDEESRRGADSSDDLLMLLATSDASDLTNTTNAQTAAWCHRNYVSAKDCNEWVADQRRRHEERLADEEARREERRKDEEKRHEQRHEHEESRHGANTSDELLMLLATPDASDLTNTTNAQTAAWCHRNYVSAKDCDEWVADQRRRHEERRADEEARRAERHRDEEARREQRHPSGTASDPLMLLATSDASNMKKEMTLLLAQDSNEDREAARKADKEKRREERREDEEARRKARREDEEARREQRRADKAAREADEEKRREEREHGGSNSTDPLMLLATSSDSNASWCQMEYVSAKDCDGWVADQLARREERRKDEEARREERRKDEEDRQQRRNEEDAASPTLLSGSTFFTQQSAIVLFVGFLSLGTLTHFALSAVYRRRLRQELALLNDPAPV